ncbi:hypothetical protein [Streptomyces caeruleatus]|uniref:Secreted protein n=1 Tax=Streptomyces caeruleatus TaxID=661399 RepID=A0A101U202_9ACTN|nr:hypothetical protein [Streptomyces caeruleatus]KUO02875.1 hypothetical protein AQJ67_20900 [Streptomyces caeruleatus]
MISTRRIVAAVGLAAGLTGLTAPMARAAEVDAPIAGRIDPVNTLDSLAATGIPERHKHRVPPVSQHLGHLDQVKGLGRLG